MFALGQKADVAEIRSVELIVQRARLHFRFPSPNEQEKR